MLSYAELLGLARKYRELTESALNHPTPRAGLENVRWQLRKLNEEFDQEYSRESMEADGVKHETD